MQATVIEPLVATFEFWAMDVKPSWVVPTKPPVKRTYQSKFKVHNKGPGVTDTLLSRAVWCYDALFGRQPLSPGAGSVGSDATAARDEIDSILPTFSRLSLEVRTCVGFTSAAYFRI